MRFAQDRFTRRLFLIVLFAPLACSSIEYPPLPSEYEQSEALSTEWLELDSIFRDASSNEDDVALLVFRRDGTLLYAGFTGRLNEKHVIPIASATKWITAAIVLRLVDRGALSLDTRTGELLRDENGDPWTGEESRISLRDLLSFQSGFPRDPDCIGDTDYTLVACVNEIYADGLEVEPGRVFEYGGSHMQIAIRMAEIASGKTWGELYRHEFATFFQANPGSRYYTRPWPRGVAGENPMAGGGLFLSIEDYARFLQMLMNDGRYQGRVYLSSGLVDQLLHDHIEPGDRIGYSPTARLGKSDYHYALGNWVEPGASTRNSSPGLFGFYPWIDRERGYYAIFGGYLGLRGTVKAMRIVDRVRPEIEARL